MKTLVARVKALGFFYLCFGLGFFAGCAFSGLMMGLGRMQ